MLCIKCILCISNNQTLIIIKKFFAKIQKQLYIQWLFILHTFYLEKMFEENTVIFFTFQEVNSR